jgi:hypothetical protein
VQLGDVPDGTLGGRAVTTDDAPGYAHVCASCDVSLEPGTYRLALAQPGGSPLEPREAVTISGPSTVTGTYTSRRGLRIAGWTLMGVGVTVGTLVAIGGATRAPTCVYPEGTRASAVCSDRPDAAPFWGVAAGLGVAAVVGLVLALQHDDATITVTPLDAGSVAPVAPVARREGAWLGTSAPGLGIAGRW